jgi:hypothetical protein
MERADSKRMEAIDLCDSRREVAFSFPLDLEDAM